MDVKISDINLDLTRTYIYDGIEYILTGRTAVKEKTSTRRPSRRRTTTTSHEPPISDIMVEITPLNKKIGIASDKKWVKPSDLFVINNELEEEDD